MERTGKLSTTNGKSHYPWEIKRVGQSPFEKCELTCKLN